MTEYSWLSDDTDFLPNQWRLRTQMDRALMFAAQNQVLLDMSAAGPEGGDPVRFFVGAHWFKYYDGPTLMEADASPYGLTNGKDEAYLPLTDLLGTVNRQVYGYAALGTPITVPPAPAPLSPANGSAVGARPCGQDRVLRQLRRQQARLGPENGLQRGRHDIGHPAGRHTAIHTDRS